MKKVLGIVSVAVFAAVMFTNTNIRNNTNSSLELDQLMRLNEADAECQGGWPQKCNSFGRCSLFGSGAAC